MANYARKLKDGRYRYGSGLTIFTEELKKGILSFSDLRADGIPSASHIENPLIPSFDIMIDGLSLYYGWTEKDFKTETLENGVIRATLTLENIIKPLKAEVITDVGDNGFMSRYIKLANLSSEPLQINSFTAFKGRMFHLNYDIPTLRRNKEKGLFSVGHFISEGWGTEGDFYWTDLRDNTSIGLGSDKGRSGFNHPFFIARNNLAGGYFMCQLAWSANWSANVKSRTNDYHGAFLDFEIKPDSPAPMRILSVGEEFLTPTAVFGTSHEDFDTLINSLHHFQLKHIMKRVVEQPVIFNHWGYMEDKLSEQKLLEQIDITVKLGGEMFIIDAGWYGKADCSWPDSTGDWVAGERLPNDLYNVFDYAHSKGLKVGLWIEAEAGGEKSSIAENHPEWFIERYGEQTKRMLDLAKPEVEEHIYNSITELIDRYNLDLVRLDFNHDMGEGGYNLRDGITENSLYRHIEAIWRIFDRIREKYPNIQLENCSSGGGRTDLGMVSRFTTTWVSDCMRQPRSAKMLNGMSLVLPPSFIDRMTGVVMDGTIYGSLDCKLQTIIMCHPAISGVAQYLEDENPDTFAKIKEYLEIYKNHIRPMHTDMNTYHHNPSPEDKGWMALEYASGDKTKGVAMVMRLYGDAESSYKINFKGLDTAKTYSVRILPSGDTFIATGKELCNNGVTVTHDNALTSSMFVIDSIECE